MEQDAQDSPTWQRLEDQLAWYSTQSGRSRRWYQWLKVLELIVAAAIPAAVAAGASAPVAGALGGVVVVLEGVQQLFGFQANWLGYRSAAEALKRERFLYMAEAGEYATAKRPLALLAERVEGIGTKENAGWAEAQVPVAAKAANSPADDGP